MKLSVSHKHVEPNRAVEKEIEHNTAKLNRLLKAYQPDLVQLHGVISKTPPPDEYSFSLTLTLPTGTLHVTGAGANTVAGCKHAFSELQTQLKKHQSRLRKDYEWKRKRPRNSEAAASL
jgi:ribosome-associated translation inhibitor RaiA